MPRHQYSSRRNPASSARARIRRAPLDRIARHAILKATATAFVFKFCGKEPEDHHAVAVSASRRHAGQHKHSQDDRRQQG